MEKGNTSQEHNIFVAIKGADAADFAQGARQVLDKLESERQSRSENGEALVWIRVFLSDVINQLPQIKEELDSLAESCAVSVIEQPPLEGGKIDIMACFLAGASAERIITEDDGLDEDEKYVYANVWSISTPQGEFIYHAFRPEGSDVEILSERSQTSMAFEAHNMLLEMCGMSIKDNTLRTWLFCRDIDHTYHGIVKGRNEFFAENGLTKDTHFIASTGIGGYTSHPEAFVGVEFLSRDGGNKDVEYLHALSHLNPTAQYGVAFERGTAFAYGDRKVLLISGTASIDNKGNCIHQGNVSRQTERLIENTDALLKDGGATKDDIKMMIFYLRDASDYQRVKTVAESLLPNVPMVFTHARVCRPGWLVEAESIAIK